MRRGLSTQCLALLAIGLSIASVLVCLRWVSRDLWRITRWERETVALESKQDELEHQLLNLAALLMKSSEESPRLSRIEPPDGPYTRECHEFFDSSPTLFRALETARANIFQMWYYEQVKKYYFNERVR